MKDLLRKDLVKTFLAESKLGFNEMILVTIMVNFKVVKASIVEIS